MRNALQIIARALLYEWMVLRRAIRDTVQAFGWWTLLGPPLCLGIGWLSHIAIVTLNWFPDLQAWLGPPQSQWWLNVVYLLAPLAAIVLLVGHVNVLLTPSRIHWEQQNAIRELDTPVTSCHLEIVFDPDKHIQNDKRDVIFRVLVRNTAAKPITNVRGELVDITYGGRRNKVKANQQLQCFKGQVVLSTKHGCGVKNPPRSFHLRAKGEELVDVIKHEKKRTDFLFVCHELGPWGDEDEVPYDRTVRERLKRWHEDKIVFGTYELKITALADNSLPASALFKFEARRVKGRGVIKVTRLDDGGGGIHSSSLRSAK